MVATPTLASAGARVAAPAYLRTPVLLLVPLGDKLERRGLAVGLMLLAGTGLLISGFAQSFGIPVAAP